LGKIVLVTGGSRSGKSTYALRQAEALPGPRVFIATCPPLDGEMRQRIRLHRRERRKKKWDTVEEQFDLAAAIRRNGKQRVLLVDCLTLWVNNLLFAAEQRGRQLTDAGFAKRCREILAASRRAGAEVIFVTNETGWGIIPENALARRFRDLAGRCNKTFAAGADEVVLLVSGLPLILKKKGRHATA
jgi:adenosylcobinamide kinase/adenosylcobinamide-phosphate guanylyltransferase